MKNIYGAFHHKMSPVKKQQQHRPLSKSKVNYIPFITRDILFGAANLEKLV